MQAVQSLSVRTSAARTISDLRRHSASLFLGHRADLEDKLALAQHDDDPSIADRAIDAVQARINAITDRISAEDVAFSRAPMFRRRTEAGHRFLLVPRGNDSRFVPLCELTEHELDHFIGVATRAG